MKPIGHTLIRLDAVDSTNNYTANLLKRTKVEHGTVILAVEQFAGRGQMGAIWWVKPGENLTCSVFLDEVKLSVQEQFNLSKMIALAVLDVFKALEIDAMIKWPNDILVDEKKVAGILIENSIREGTIQNAIVGIGINVNQTEFGDLNATSIQSIKNGFYAVDSVLELLTNKLEVRWKTRLNMEELHTEYCENLLGYQQKRSYEIDSEMVEGIIEDVLPNGKLVVETGLQRRELDLKEVRFILRNAL